MILQRQEVTIRLIELTLELRCLLLGGHLLIDFLFNISAQGLRILLEDIDLQLQLIRPFLHLALMLILGGSKLVIGLLVHLTNERLLLVVGLNPQAA